MSATTTATTITTQEVISWGCCLDLFPAEGDGVLGGRGGEFGEFSHDGFLGSEEVGDEGVSGPRRRPGREGA